jgi:hypothetical protein
LQNKFGGLEIKFYLCTRFESRAADFRKRSFLNRVHTAQKENKKL